MEQNCEERGGVTESPRVCEGVVEVPQPVLGRQRSRLCSVVDLLEYLGKPEHRGLRVVVLLLCVGYLVARMIGR